jgi:hypothetical protein
MLKKIASISLIITVNFCLLAIPVVSHHHHNGIPHFAVEQPVHEQAEEDPNSCNPNEKNETCVFEQNIIIFNGTRLLCSQHNLPGELAQALFFVPANDFSSAQEKRLPEPPYLISYYSIAANSGLGLRAPPAA